MFFLSGIAAGPDSDGNRVFLTHIIFSLHLPESVNDILDAYNYGFNANTGDANFYCPTCKLRNSIKKANKCPYVEAIETDRPWVKCPGYGLSHPLFCEVAEIIRWVKDARAFDLDNLPQLVYNIWDWYCGYKSRLEAPK